MYIMEEGHSAGRTLPVGKIPKVEILDADIVIVDRFLKLDPVERDRGKHADKPRVYGNEFSISS